MSLEEEGRAAMQMVFNQFKRTAPVTFYKSASQEIVVQDADHNADFWNPYSSGIVESGQSSEFECRILWPSVQELSKVFKLDVGTAVKASIPNGVVKIQMESGAYEYFEDTKAVYIQGDKYIPHGDLRKIGIFGSFQFFEFLGIKDV